MESFYSLPEIESEADALHFFKEAIEYRNNYKSEDGRIARFVFDSTHKITTGFELSPDIDWIRAEFIALEGPGMPIDNEVDPDEYVDKLWARLDMMIDEAIEKRGGSC